MKKVDLHSHTTQSDGSLTPKELIERAVLNQVEILSITDHDTVAAYGELNQVDLGGLTLISGIELSSQWRGVNVHIVGLKLNLTEPGLITAVSSQQAARSDRATLITQRLIKAGIPIDADRVLQIANMSNIGRPHFAQHMVELGVTKNMSTAFKKYLGNGKIGDVKQCWPNMSEVVEWIHVAGGVPVLAHPLKYTMTRTKLRALVDEFVEAGGQALEVVSGQQTTDESNYLARLCREKKLLASCGSDFHQPSQWSDIGKMSPFPKDCEAVWLNW